MMRKIMMRMKIDNDEDDDDGSASMVSEEEGEKRGETICIYQDVPNCVHVNWVGNILVVDDIDTQREISCKAMELLGYKCTAVPSGEEAVEYLRRNSADLILLDMIMEPGMNGYETYKKIIEMHPGQKTIILSGYSETDDVKKAQAIGAGKYVKKPFTIEKIGTAIKEELN